VDDIVDRAQELADAHNAYKEQYEELFKASDEEIIATFEAGGKQAV